MAAHGFDRATRGLDLFVDPDERNIELTSPLEGLAAACAASSYSRYSRAFGHTRRAPRGVRRFRSIEEADAHRRDWESAQAG